VSRQVVVITVTGEMDRLLRDEFDDVEIVAEHGVSHIRIARADPSELHGVLHRVEALGLELLDVRTSDAPPP
jgi:hypothetical protein